MKLPWTRAWAALGLIALGACADEPTAPATYSITGHLRLTGFFVNADGSYAGTRVVGYADGIGVELLYGSRVVARTTTVGGVYRFSGLRSGGYVARSWVVGDIGDKTPTLTIAVSDVSSLDTLRLVPKGDLHPVPNPFTDTTQVDFNVPDTAYIDVNILDATGAHIKNLLSQEVRPRRHAVFWNGTDQLNHPVAGTYFWITYVSGADVRAQLLFRNPLQTIASVKSSAAPDQRLVSIEETP
jgi:hypothetical protein